MTKKHDTSSSPHRRLNPLTQEWVLVSPQRTERPWHGQVEELPASKLPIYDPHCYLCPGNARAGGEKNPKYENTFVFENDFAALRPNQPESKIDEAKGLIHAESERGVCKVVCFSPRHDLTLSRMSQRDVEAVVKVWTEEYNALAALPFVRYVQIFENRGEMMGCSNPHPHGQIWATESVPNEPAKELKSFREYARRNHSCLLCDYMAHEERAKERLVYENQEFAVVVPYWAVWPFETLVLSRSHVGDLSALSGAAQKGLAETLRILTRAYDALFDTSFPYSMGFHQRPSDGEEHKEWHFHAHFYPPLLRSVTVRKFMVGFELLGMPQRDLTAESAAERMRAAVKSQPRDRG